MDFKQLPQVAWSGDDDVIKQLLESNKPTAHLRFTYGRFTFSPLAWYCSAGMKDLQLARELLFDTQPHDSHCHSESVRDDAATALLHQCQRTGKTVLHSACEDGLPDVVKLLITAATTAHVLQQMLQLQTTDSSWGPHQLPGGQTPLHSCCCFIDAKGKAECARQLVAAGADQTMKDSNDNTVWLLAHMFGRESVKAHLETPPPECCEAYDEEWIRNKKRSDRLATTRRLEQIATKREVDWNATYDRNTHSMRIIIVHAAGVTQATQQHWYAALGARLSAEIPADVSLRTITDPNRTMHECDWLPFLQQLVEESSQKTYIIGHSLGAVAILRLLEKQSVESCICGALLLSVGEVPLAEDEVEPSLEERKEVGWFDRPFEWSSIIQSVQSMHTIGKKAVLSLVHCVDDDVVPISEGHRIFGCLQDAAISEYQTAGAVDFIEFQSGGHFMQQHIPKGLWDTVHTCIQATNVTN
jgi:predicted alpha/beta hydrolase family esterase